MAPTVLISTRIPTNMKIITASILLLAFALCHTAYGQSFPNIQTEGLQKETVSIPQDLSGKKSIIFLAFTPAAERILDDWYAPVYIMFLDKSGFNAMAYDCHVKLVMMFTGSSQAAAGKIKEKIRMNIDESMNDYLLFYEGNFSDQMRALDIKKKNDAYVVVLDEQGNVMTIETGEYTEKKLEKIADMVEL